MDDVSLQDHTKTLGYILDNNEVYHEDRFIALQRLYAVIVARAVEPSHKVGYLLCLCARSLSMYLFLCFCFYLSALFLCLQIVSCVCK